MKFLYLLTFCCCIAFTNCDSANPSEKSDEEQQSDAAIEKLLTLFTGEFDNIAQVKADKKLTELSEEERHGRVNRIFLRVDAPKVGKYVIVGSTRYNGHDGKPWYFDKTEFLVWKFTAAADGQTITMAPKRFKNLEDRIPYAQDAKKLAGFAPEDLEQAISGAACDITWTPTEYGFAGKNKPCSVKSTTTGKMLNWDWRYQLSDNGILGQVKGRDEEGTIVYSTPGESPYELNRMEKS